MPYNATAPQDLSPSTLYLNGAPIIHRTYFSSDPYTSPATGSTIMVQVQRTQLPGSGFIVGVRNTSPSAYSFSLQQSNDGGVTDAYSGITFYFNGSTATSVNLQPGGYAEVEVPSTPVTNSALGVFKPYVALVTSSGNTSGACDWKYNNGSFDRMASQNVTGYVKDVSQLDSGVVPITNVLTSVLTVQRIGAAPWTPGTLLLGGQVGTSALTGLTVLRQDSPNGPWVTVGANGSLNTVDATIQYSTTNAYTTGANGVFELGLSVAGAYSYNIFAASATAGGSSLRLTAIL